MDHEQLQLRRGRTGYESICILIAMASGLALRLIAHKHNVHFFKGRQEDLICIEKPHFYGMFALHFIACIMCKKQYKNREVKWCIVYIYMHMHTMCKGSIDLHAQCTFFFKGHSAWANRMQGYCYFVMPMEFLLYKHTS